MVEAFENALLSALAPLDAMRARVLRVLGPIGRTFLRNRAARVALSGGLGVSFALLLTALAPLVLLTLGPLLLGVPHLIADLRYMVVRQDVHRRTSFWLCVAPFLVLCIASPQLSWGSCAVAAAALCARARIVERVVAALMCLGVALAARRLGTRGDILFAHAHNLVALLLWVVWSRGHKRQVLPALALYALGTFLIFSGQLEHALFRLGSLAQSPIALSAGDLAPTLSPVQHPLWALRWLLFFAFSQSLHYAVWLRLVPDEDRDRAGIRSFSASYRCIARELGRPLLALAVVAALVLLALACLKLSLGRDGYLRLALFHGPLEIAVAVQLLLERRKLAHVPR